MGLLPRRRHRHHLDGGGRAGLDPLTAYLATSPGGADTVAIIAASTPVDVPFVMAMQTGRFLLVLALGPSLARLVARLLQQRLDKAR